LEQLKVKTTSAQPIYMIYFQKGCSV